MKDPSTWPNDAAQLYDQVLRSRGSNLHLKQADKVGQVQLRQTRSFGAEGKWPDIATPMERQTALRFVARFIQPLLAHATGRKWLAAVVNGRHAVAALWAVGRERFGLTGTVAPDGAKAAANKNSGSTAIIFIDEHGIDWTSVPDLKDMPDIGFFHELYHAAMNQQGRNDGMTEREARIEENRYRNQRGASSLRKLP